MADVASAGDCEGGARESTFRSASVWAEGAGADDGEAEVAVVDVDVEEGGGGGALGSDISRRAATICSRTRIARSATSATVRPVVGMGGRTVAMQAQHKEVKIRTRLKAQSDLKDRDDKKESV